MNNKEEYEKVFNIIVYRAIQIQTNGLSLTLSRVAQRRKYL